MPAEAVAPQKKASAISAKTKGKTQAIHPPVVSDVVIDAMTRELKRSFEKLKNKGQAPLFPLL